MLNNNQKLFDNKALKYLMREFDLKPEYVAKLLHISRSSVYYKKCGRSKFNAEHQLNLLQALKTEFKKKLELLSKLSLESLNKI